MPRFTATFRSTSERFSAGFRETSERFSAGFMGVQPYVNVPTYEGAYEFTPSDEAQTIPTAGMRVIEDIVIDAIPSNYGKITWDGSILTVS